MPTEIDTYSISDRGVLARRQEKQQEKVQVLTVQTGVRVQEEMLTGVEEDRAVILDIF